jgi:hypothetical protein
VTISPGVKRLGREADHRVNVTFFYLTKFHLIYNALRDNFFYSLVRQENINRSELNETHRFLIYADDGL